MEIKYREIKESDNAQLAGMIREVFEEHGAPQMGTVYSDPATDDLYRVFREPGSILWVAEGQDMLLGCCGIYPTDGLPEGCAELVKFYLPATARGKGIGRELMRRSMESARDFGYKQLYLESLPVYSKAVGIYEKQGFRMLDKAMGNSGHTTCNIWMIRDL
jgi:putative acetyltransferase